MAKQGRDFKYHPVSFDDEDDDVDLGRELGPSSSANRRGCTKFLRAVVIVGFVLATVGAVAIVVLCSTIVFSRRDDGGNSTAVTEEVDGGGNFTVGSGNFSIGSGNFTVGGGNFTVGGGNFSVGSDNQTDSSDENSVEEAAATAGEDQQEAIDSDESTAAAEEEPEEADIGSDQVTGATMESSSRDAAAATESVHEATDQEVVEAGELGEGGDGGNDGGEKNESSTADGLVVRLLESNDVILGHAVSDEAQGGGHLGFLMRDHMIASAALLSVALLVLTCLICCVLRLVRKRRRQRKQHFSRLVNDLNQKMDKFAMVSASDEDFSE